MNTNELVRMLVASGAVRVTPGGEVKLEPERMSGHWVDRGQGWQRDPADGDGGGRHEGRQDTGD